MKKQYKTPRVRVFIPENPKEILLDISNTDTNDGFELGTNTDFGWDDDEE